MSKVFIDDTNESCKVVCPVTDCKAPCELWSCAHCEHDQEIDITPVKMTKIQRYCSHCNIVCEHDHGESINEEQSVRSIIDVCMVCGNVDLDHDSIDEFDYLRDMVEPEEIPDEEYYKECERDRVAEIWGFDEPIGVPSQE